MSTTHLSTSLEGHVREKKHLIGLDVGSATIKAGELVEAKQGYALRNFAMEDIAPGLIVDGNVADPGGLANSISEMFTLHKLKERKVAVSIGGYAVIVKKISVKNSETALLSESIAVEAEQYIPFDINDVNLDYHVVGSSQEQANRTNLMLVAAKKEVIDDYASVIEAAGLVPSIVDVDAFALQNICELNYGVRDHAIALIDIGASKTSLNIVKDNVSLLMRDVSLGCGQINQQISTRSGCSLTEAEEIKLGTVSGKLTAQELEQIESATIGGWCSEIRRAIDFYYSTYPDDPVKQVLLSGGGAHIESFRKRLAVETSAAVETINPFLNLKIESNRFDPNYLSTIAPQAAICLGLALRSVDDK